MSGDELNPERQNAINRSIDANDRQVIDSFARKPVESKEDLVNTFTYFTMDDVKGSELKEDKISMRPVTSFKNNTSTEKPARSIQEVKPGDTEQKTFDEDGIEEEILDEGIKTGTMVTCKTPDNVSHKQPHRQFGNYVDEGDSDDDAGEEERVDTDQGYTASFSNTEVKPEKEKKDMSNPEHVKKMESLPHSTEKAGECELSALVDTLYEEGEEEEEEEGDRLNPGEVEEEDDIPSLSDLERVTCLEITTTRESSGDTTLGTSNSESNMTMTDQVEEFKLDEDFDYDNVKLTPKFTQDELTYLKSFIPSESNST